MYFKDIDTEEKAYWLGFLYTDGYVKKRTAGKYDFELSVASKDFSHIEKFKKSISYGGQIKDKIVKLNGKEFLNHRIIISRKEFCIHLIDNGCIENKTFNLSFPKNIDKSLIRHFIRGVFDGDGCVTISNRDSYVTCEIVGCLKFLEEIKTAYISNSNLDYIPSIIIGKDKRHSDGINYIRMNGDKNAVDFLRYIYDDSTIFLDRKYDIYKKIINSN